MLLVGSRDRQLEEAVRVVAPHVTTAPTLGAIPGGTSEEPHVVVLDVREQSSVPPGLAAVRRAHPSIGIIVVASRLDPEMMLRFYSHVFGMREVPSSYLRRQQGRGNRFCADGKTNLALHPFYNPIEGHEPRFGINHIGFLVDNMQATMAELSTVLKIAPRPSTRPYAEFRFRDIEGNPLDLSQTKGWEVDVGKWETAA